MAADNRHGIATSVLANISRDPKKKPDPYTSEDFIYWRKVEQPDQAAAPLDKEAHSRLIKRALFKR